MSQRPRPRSRLLAGVGYAMFAALLLGFAALMTAPILWPIAWIRWSGVRGAFHLAMPAAEPGALLLVERASIGHGHSTDVDRLHRIGIASGATLGAPCVVGLDLRYAGYLGSDLFVRSPLHDGDMGSGHLALVDPAACRERDELRPLLDTLTADAQVSADASRLTATGRDGRPWVVRAGASAAASSGPNDGRPGWRPADPKASDAALGGRTLELVGERRRRLRWRDTPGPDPAGPGDEAGPDLLDAKLLVDAATREAIGDGNGVLVAHHGALGPDGTATGLWISAVAPGGAERWRYVAGDHDDVEYAQRSGSTVVLVIVGGDTDEGDENVLCALDLPSGRVVWRRRLHDLPP